MADWTQPTLDEHLTEVATLRETHLLEQLEASYNHIEVLTESLADVQLAFEDRGWMALATQAQYELSDSGRNQIRDLCRVMTLMNPLIKRGLSLRKAYIWGQGVDIVVRDQSGTGQDVNAVVQTFLDDKGNRKTFSGSQAREEMEQRLYNDGEGFAALFTNRLTGKVQVRWLPVQQITEVITDPEDDTTHWFYRREYTERLITASGQTVQQLRTVYYPALGYEPQQKYATIDGNEVMWNAPVRAVVVNRPTEGTRGIPDAFAAIAWARAYKEFLEQWAILMKALARFAWNKRTRGDKVKDTAAKLAARPDTDYRGGNPDGVGATHVGGPNDYLEAIPKSGATIDADSGRPLAALTAAALDVPVTMLLGDPGMNGARAVAETLDEPTQLTMNLRRETWSEFMLDVLNHVIDWAVRAPQGPLKGRVTRDPGADRVTVLLPDDDDRTIDISWPDFDSTPVETLVKAIVEADGTMKLPPLVTLRLLLQALKVDDIDEVLDEVTDDDGNYVDPEVTAGQAAVDRFRQGKDPAGALNGGQDDPANDPEVDDPEADQ